MKLRRFLILTWLACSLPHALGDDGLKPSETKMKSALHAVIAQQLEAFRVGDYAAAYVFADAAIKSMFPLERFEQMVKSGFPIIAHSASAKFGLTFDNGDDAVVNVRVFGADRPSVDYQYTLRRDGEVWRITGVALLRDQTTEV